MLLVLLVRPHGLFAQVREQEDVRRCGFTWKTGYDGDIGLFADRRQALRYAVLVTVAAALPLLLDDFMLGRPPAS